MFEITWCNLCNSRPSDGKLTVIIEGQEEVLDACEPCVNDPEMVEFDTSAREGIA